MQLADCVVRVDMPLGALRQLDGPILFAHADLSGFSVFEEAARLPLKHTILLLHELFCSQRG
jgi:hypothetical protein